MTGRPCGLLPARCASPPAALRPLSGQASPRPGQPRQRRSRHPLAARCPPGGAPRRLVRRLWTAPTACGATGGALSLCPEARAAAPRGKPAHPAVVRPASARQRERRTGGKRPRVPQPRVPCLRCPLPGDTASWGVAYDTPPPLRQYPLRPIRLPGWQAGLPCTQVCSDHCGSPQSLLVRCSASEKPSLGAHPPFPNPSLLPSGACSDV
jgi:hypothetical protein